MKLLRLSLVWTVCMFLLPVLLIQAFWARRRVLRLPEADQPNQGHFGIEGVEGGSHFSILGLGDSVIAGVGCQSLDESITARLAECLHEMRGLNVKWEASGANGARLEDVLKQIPQLANDLKPDLLVVSVGVNDVTHLTSLLKWQLQVTRLIAELKEKFAARIVLLGVPPMNLFTGLPQPLRFTLGIRAAMLDIALKRSGELLDDVSWVSPPLATDDDSLAEDGYHPSAKACKEMARQIETVIPNVAEGSLD